jgi:hypothetical protein
LSRYERGDFSRTARDEGLPATGGDGALPPHGGGDEVLRTAQDEGLLRHGRKTGAFPRYERGERRGTRGVPALRYAFSLFTRKREKAAKRE